MFWRGLLCLAALFFSVGCAALRAGPAGFPHESITLPPASSQYSTEPQPEGAWGEGAQQLEKRVVETLRERGDHAESDGALSATATWAMRELSQGRSIDTVALDTASRRYGFGGVPLAFVAFEMKNEGWRSHLDNLPRNLPITRYGIRMAPSGRWATIVFGSVEIRHEPIPRAFDPGQTVTLKGQIGQRFKVALVYLTKPDGTVQEQRMRDRSFDVSFPLTTTGVYRLEVMGDGPTGPVVVSNVPLYVGVSEPAARGLATGAVVDPEEAEARMLELLNTARRKAGLPAVQADAELRAIAMAHTEDMDDEGFVSHVSPNTGTPDNRLRRSGALVSMFGENVAGAGSAELAHEQLMSSPGHRANMLRAEFTHVGIGATKSSGFGLLVTMVFGRRPAAAAMPTSVAQIEQAVAALRSEKQVPAARVDGIYRVSAQAGANALATGADDKKVGEAVQAAMQKEANRLRVNKSGYCVMILDLLEIAQLKETPILARPELRLFGAGASLRRDARGSRLATVLVVEGVRCQ